MFPWYLRLLVLFFNCFLDFVLFNYIYLFSFCVCACVHVCRLQDVVRELHGFQGSHSGSKFGCTCCKVLSHLRGLLLVVFWSTCGTVAVAQGTCLAFARLWVQSQLLQNQNIHTHPILRPLVLFRLLCVFIWVLRQDSPCSPSQPLSVCPASSSQMLGLQTLVTMLCVLLLFQFCCFLLPRMLSFAYGCIFILTEVVVASLILLVFHYINFLVLCRESWCFYEIEFSFPRKNRANNS